MMEHTKGVITGALATILVIGITTTALAATGAISLNQSPIQFNGQQISAAGEDYTLDNGCMAPSSITYTDEKGGGTTYLPARRIAELMGVGIGYDATTGAVTVSGEAASAPTTTPAPDTTASAADYSDWTAEEEAAYQEFKGLWRVDKHDVFTEPVMGQSRAIYAIYNGSLSDNDLKTWMNACGSTTMNQYAERMMREFYSTEDYLRLVFVGSGKPVLWVTSLEVFNGNLTVHTDFADDAFSSFRN